jgi:NAD(P)-dependent dehydrogenase (short-subunit alcohol dehydrogenase family)
MTGAIGLPGLSGRRVLVTGAASGIGRATAQRLSAEGCTVAFVDHDAEGVGAALPDAPHRAIALTADVRDEGSIAAAVAAAVDAFGGLDVIVANAGIEPPDDDRADRLSLEVWKRVIDTNLTGVFLTCKHGLRALLASDNDNRSVVITLSPTGVRGSVPDQEAYSTSKAALFGFMRNLSRDFADAGIRVNGVVPGFTRTAATEPIFANPERLAFVERLVPLGRAATPDEIANMFAWLVSDEARFATGAVFSVDGGQTAI